MSFFTYQTAETPLKEAWWLEVGTFDPLCLYYFGSFENEQEADAEREGYLQDLRNESSHIIFARSRFCQPRKLTIEQNELTIQDLEVTPVHFFEALVLH
jgi:Domain of unknown function (DUF1816)